MTSELDREALREQLRSLSVAEHRIVLERVAEQLSDAVLDVLLEGLVRLKTLDAAGPPAPSLFQRV